MSLFIMKKFNAFEAYLRKHFKAESLKFDEIKSVHDIDHDAFFAYYLKILLETLDDLKRKSKPEVSDSVNRKLKPGTRSSVPYPKDGLAAIKSGTIPELNLYNLIKDTINGAISGFYKAIQVNKDLLKALEDVNTDEIKLDELYKILTNPVSNVTLPIKISPEFDIKLYLKETDAKFIYPEVRTHIQWMHENIVVPLLERGSLHFDDALIQYGILPLMYTDTYIAGNLVFAFNNGYGVGLRFYEQQKYDEAIEYIQSMCEFDRELNYYRYNDHQLVLIIKTPSR